MDIVYNGINASPPPAPASGGYQTRKGCRKEAAFSIIGS